MKLKICGMKYADNIRDVANLSPDFMGFIFYPKSKRFVGEDFTMPEMLSKIKKVGVFVNDSIENIFEQVKKHSLDFVQLHGDESPEQTSKVFKTFEILDVRVIKAFGIDDQFDFSILMEYENCCDYFLFDTKSNEYGGSGNRFDRNILKYYKLSKPYFLSGGIDSINVGELCPFAIDVNSKFEIEPGLKDSNKLKILKDELSGK
ncbi:MAG: phosphoribosylanthranilate isomerase [Bacteroidetes bacterium]|nr:phosphoribosylanthranilate isomerase [Bacteroidota bacterium]